MKRQRRLKINEIILRNLLDAQKSLSEENDISPDLVPHRAAMKLFLDTWVRSRLDLAIEQIKGEVPTRRWGTGTYID